MQCSNNRCSEKFDSLNNKLVEVGEIFLATTRVYILAKELGVKSSAIIKKCQDENLDVKNHMSVISAGLAATIQEWFSEGENVTTVETSEKVDLSKVRIKRKKKEAPVDTTHDRK